MERDTIGANAISAITPKAFSEAIAPPSISAIAAYMDMMTATDMGPVATPPASYVIPTRLSSISHSSTIATA